MSNEISLREMQKIELNIVNEFNDVCIKNHIKYFLGYGSCIGAVRHSGFIPWDDDIDIVMLYKDYMKLIDYYKTNNNGRYKLLCSELDPTVAIPYAKIIDTYTELNEYETSSESLGVYIDIFPLYYLPDRKVLRDILFFKLKILDYFYSCSRKKNIKGKTFIRSVAQAVIKPISLVWGEVRINKKSIKTIKNGIKDRSNFVSILPPIYGKKEIMPSEIFDSSIMKRFEDLNLPIPAGYDEYLSNIYGDYMKLPPIDKQVTHHKYIVKYKNI